MKTLKDINLEISRLKEEVEEIKKNK